MNCREFARTMINQGIKPGSEHLTEDAGEAQALAHAEACPLCAARLARERRMMDGIRALADEEAKIDAPERVRLSLRAAFDKQLAAGASRAPSSRVRRWFRWELAAATLLVLIFIGMAAVWLRQPQEDISQGSHLMANKLASPVATPEMAEREQLVKQVDTAPVPITRSPGRWGQHKRFPAQKNSEETGELFPLTFVAKSESTEFIQTVRVELSRSVLMSMGVPVNVDRGERPIKADIIIGEDGVARAVRILN